MNDVEGCESYKIICLEIFALMKLEWVPVKVSGT